MRLDKKQVRKPTRMRIRKKIAGDAQRPRVAIFRSSKHFYLQAFDDATGSTITSVSSLDPELRKKLKSNAGNVKGATEVGNEMAKRLQDKGIKQIVFDRGGFIYHGRIKAAAEAMRKAGLKF